MRTVLLVLDSVGCGALPDAAYYGDEQSNTLLHTAMAVGKLQLPTLERLGLGNILTLPEVQPTHSPEASYGCMMMASPGKDTITGHWEMAGIRLEQPFPLYPQGFPPEIMEAFEKRIGRKTLGNLPASGTEIVDLLGEEHLRTGSPIVYTSADSVFQVAAHDRVVPLEELYDICLGARELLQGRHRVARVIARPFTGDVGFFSRSAHRHDYAVLPPTPNLLTILHSGGFKVHGVGKISDIFGSVGIFASHPTKNNQEGLLVTEELLGKNEPDSFYFVNLVDFDSLYGHRNDPQGYALALQEFDSFLPRILWHLRPDDRLIVTADHGCDPTVPGTDHTREYVPLLVYQRGRKGCNLGTRTSFADIAATECAARGLEYPLHGEVIEPLLQG